MTYLIPILRRKGYRVSAYGISGDTKELQIAKEQAYGASSAEEAVRNAKAVVGGIPYREEGSAYVSKLEKGQIYFGGNIPQQVQNELETKGIEVVDLLKIESVRVENSIATAEGVIKELLERNEELLTSQHFLVFGYGRCGKLIVDRILGMRGKVTVISRNPVEKSWLKAAGIEIVDLQDWRAGAIAYEKNMVLVNTMPIDHILPSGWQEHSVAEKPWIDVAGTLQEEGFVYVKGLPGRLRAKAMANCYGEEIDRYYTDRTK